MPFTGGYQSNVSGGGGGSNNGAVFITDILPQSNGDNVGGKLFSSGGRVLNQCVTNTTLVRVHVLAITGNTHFEPNVTVEGQSINLTQDEDQSVWTGFIDLDISGKSSVTAIHEDGPQFTCQVTADTGPQIESAIFTGGYPTGQTELKAGDTFDLLVSTDVDMIRIEVVDFGAGVADSFDFAATTSKTITIEIANRGNSAQSLGVRLRAMNANGSYGDYFVTSGAGSDDGVNVVVLNNRHPQINFGAIVYPVNQQALKDSEVATVNHTVSDFDNIAYSSPNGELNISNLNTYEAAKSATRTSGGYNIAQSNFRITATRTANGATTTANSVVQIAHIVPQVTVQFPAARLVSGGNLGTQEQSHEITISSNQQLIGLPTISAPEGTLQDDMSAGPGISFTQTLSVHDDDTKGTYTLQLTGATNLAGKVVTAFTGGSDYTLGGFVQRTFTVPRFEREAALGTQVTNTAKLSTQDKDGTTMSYANNFTNALLAYTITGPTGQLNANGTLFYWNDDQAVNNNTTGLATITIAEAP